VSPSTVKEAEKDDSDGPLRFRTIWISDLHLGTTGCQAQHLIDFLRATESEFLYLVGDIVDGWQLCRRWYWPQTHNDVVQKVLRKARKGTRVVFIPGNHDEFGRHFLKLSFGGIEVSPDAVHTTADGRRLLVLHGDLFDAVVQRVRWLAIVGDRLHTATLHLNRWLNAMRARMGFPYWSLAQYLKLKVKDAVKYMVDFECAVAAEAKRRGADGVVCGHIHKAEIREIDGILYCNDGDWVESLTALVETDCGELRIVRWHEVAAQVTQTLSATREGMTLAYIGRH
jgi:UDP-2,3-diacylglucosamine pyrophosphatase LpxH